MASFNKAFAAARKELGAGKTFTWQGKSYSTNLAGEDKPKGFSVEMAKSAIDKAVGPKPMKRPAVSTSKDAPMQTSPRPPKKPTELRSTSPVVTPKITTTKLATPAKNTSTPASSVAASNKIRDQIRADKNKAMIEEIRKRNAERDAKKVEAVTGGSNSTIVKYLKENNLDKKGVSLTDALVAAAAVGTEAALLKVAYDRLKKGRGKGPTPSTDANAPKAKLSTTLKPSPNTSPMSKEDRRVREAKVRKDAAERAARVNATADKNIKAKADQVAKVRANAAVRSELARANVDNAYARRAESARAARLDAAERLKIQRNFAKATKPKVGGSNVRGSSMDLTRGVGTGGSGGISNAAIERALNPLNLAKGGLITKKKK